VYKRQVLGYVWDLPFAKSLRGAPGVALDGWTFSGIMTLASGFPFNVQQSGDSMNIDALWPRPNLLSDQRVELDTRTPDLWFNTNAFTRAVASYGTSPRNPVVGPGTKTWDLSIGKNFRLPYREGHQLQFRTELFNAFNTPQFGNPGGTLGTGTFGRITSTALDNRQIQFALKYMF